VAAQNEPAQVAAIEKGLNQRRETPQAVDGLKLLGLTDPNVKTKGQRTQRIAWIGIGRLAPAKRRDDRDRVIA
jgi:hypothetical protein